MTLAHDELQHSEHNGILHSAHKNEYDGFQTGLESGCEHESHDDLDLENAIGDAFKQFALMGVETGHQTSEVNDVQSAKPTTNTSPHFDLVENPTYSEQVTTGTHNTIDMEIERAVGNYFKSGEDHHFERDPTQTTYTEHQKPVDSEIHGIDHTNNNINDRILPQTSGNQSHQYIPNKTTVNNEEEERLENLKQENLSTWSPSSESSLIRRPDQDIIPDYPIQISQKEKQVSEKTLDIPSGTEVLSPHDYASSKPLVEDEIIHRDTSKHVSSPKTNKNTQGDESGEESDQDLANAIGDAFKSVVGDLDHSKHTPTTVPYHVESGAQDIDDVEFDDTKLEEAIGQAFKTLTETMENGHGSDYSIENPHHKEQRDDLRPSQLYSHTLEYCVNNHIKDDSQEVDDDIKLSALVQDVVQQIRDSEIKPSSRENVYAKTSDSISSQSIDASSNHDVNLETDAMSVDLDAALKVAVESAVRSAFPSGRLQPASIPEPSPDKDSDLDQIKMNEILQDAFNMAMQASEEPATSSEETIEHVVKPQPANKTASAKIGISAASSKASKNSVKMKKASVSATQSPTKPRTKKGTRPLSIAETLALHRENMSASTQRDYSSINSLEDSIRSGTHKTFLPPSQVHPQLSTILSSLSQHIQSGTHSSNLMSVIRSMTNALMHNKRVLNSFSKAGQDFIKSIKSSADDKKFFLKCLETAIQYLHTRKDDDYRIKAIRLIESIAGSLETRKQKNNPADFIPTEDKETLPDNLPPFYDTAFSSLTDLDLSRLRLVIAGVKPEVDSNEYLNRVREGNRERKKKWREENAERNKDNDLRCRVLKRAAAKFGEASSDEKSSWVEKEYLKRKNRRLLRQQKDQAKFESPNSSDENTGSDPLFVKRITEIFNLVSECGYEEDPRATLMALCAMIATGASQCAQILLLTDTSIVLDAISQVVNSIYESNLRACTSRKFHFLIRRADQPPSLITRPDKISEDGLHKLTESKDFTYTSLESSEKLSEVSADFSRQSQKRFGIEFSYSNQKRLKTGQTLGSTMSQPISDATADLDDSDMSSSNDAWNSSASLKMPQYRKPLVTSKVKDFETSNADGATHELADAFPKISSPFISNKIGINAVGYPGASSFKKPGGLQRPGFTKSTNRSNMLGFPTLYSPSFRSK